MYEDALDCGISPAAFWGNSIAENLDITAGTIGKIEIGRTGISIDLLICMSDFFEVPTDYIILGKKSDMRLLKGEIHNIIVRLEEIEKSM